LADSRQLNFAFVPVIRGESGLLYVGGALAVGAALLYYSARFAFQRSIVSARQLLFASILYLPVLLALLSMDKG
jgi:heme o synthase